MEKHAMANVCRGCVTVVTLSLFLAVTTTHAQVLVNPGFESGSGLYTNLDNPSQITTAAVGWVQINDAIRLSINDACSSEIAHSGTYALQCFGPSVDNENGQPGGSYAQQSISNGVAPGQVWVLNGYGLTPSCDPMSDTPIGFSSFGALQIQFYDSTGTNQIGGGITSQSLYALNDPNTNNVGIPLDTWISCTVTAVAPPNAAVVSFLAMHIGDGTSSGSIYWDDLSVTNLGIPVTPPITTNNFQAVIQSGNQVCWPSSVTASYQPQFSDDNVNWTNIGSLIPGDGATDCVFAVSHKFYRVMQSQ